MSIIQEGAGYPESFAYNPAVDVTIGNEAAASGARNELAERGDLCGVIEDPALILRARQMVADRYLKRKYITAEEIGDDGTIRGDDSHSHAQYLADLLTSDEDSPIIGTLRKINWDPEKGDESFPVWLHKQKFDPEAVKAIEADGLENCVEVSALVKSPKLDKDHLSTLRLYRSLLHGSLEKYAETGKEETYLMATSPVLFKMFKQSFNGYISRIGEDLDYPGQDVIPAVIRPRNGLLDAIKQMGEKDFDNPQLEFTINFFIDGIDKSKVDPELADALTQAEERKSAQSEQVGVEEVPTVADSSKGEPGFTKELIAKRKPEIVAAAGLIGYTVLRTLGVAKGISPDTDVDWRVFLGIEVATTPTYVKGMGDLIRSTLKPEAYTRRQKIGATALAGSSFIAPYAYVLGEGADMPKTALAGVVAVLGASAASVYSKVRKARKQRSELSSDVDQNQ